MAHIELDGNRCKSATVFVPRVGPWVAEVELDSPIELDAATPVALLVGSVTLRGTMLAEASGKYLVRSMARMVGGAGGWRKYVDARAHHNDAQISARSVLETVAAAVGETLADESIPKLLAVDYFRMSGPARQALQRIAPGWWVDFDGVTHLLPRASSTPSASAVLKDYWPIPAVARYTILELTDIAIGASSNGKTVQALEFTLVKEFQAAAWLA